LPGGSLFAATYDRAYMQLADRGGASNIVGDRWADVCAAAIARDGVDLRTGLDGNVAQTSFRLDDIPQIARLASSRKLQNPDFLLIDSTSPPGVMWAADAKFSVDTARSKQVSAVVTEALLGLGPVVLSQLPALGPGLNIRDGVFLCPDYSLTHRLLRERRGPRRATVHADEVRFIPVTPREFLAPLGHESLQSYLASLDDLPFDPESSLMLAVYYFRLARAAVGCWQDQTAPLLTWHDAPQVDEQAVEAEAHRQATMRTSAWGLLQRWNDAANIVREQRAAVDRATSLPIYGKQVREDTLAAAAAAGVEPPSSGRVRRAIGSWFRGRIRSEFGPILPPVDDFEPLLRQLSAFSRSLIPELEQVTKRTIAELVADSAPLAPEAVEA
jgi:hypothetical protein